MMTVITINVIVLFIGISGSSSGHMIGLYFLATLDLEKPSDLLLLMKCE